jgi:hypothetical protein
VGAPGMFDDCGVCPLQTLEIQGKLHLYYLGVQRAEKIPYLYFCGLAKWNELSQSFDRVQSTPILDRTPDEPHIRSAVTVLPTEIGFEMWYVGANDWIEVDGKAVPTYRIHRAESEDGIKWQVTDRNCISFQNDDEFGFGRPWVLKGKNGYEMFYSVRELNFDVGEEAWENESICYPCVIEIKGKRYMFYNGNGNGRTGFGVAEWEENNAS